MTRILMVDDHPLIRRGMAGVLTDAFPEAQVVEAGDAQQALDFVWKQDWDVVILDVNLPGKSGLEVLKEIKGARPKLPVLVLSMHPEDQFAVRILRAGAAGYLTKSNATEVLAEAIRKVLRGGRYITPTLAERLASDLERDTTRPLHETLSDREYEIMRLLASGKTVSEIAEKLHLSVKTISTYRTRVLEKMRMKNNAELMQYAVRNHLVDLDSLQIPNSNHE